MKYHLFTSRLAFSRIYFFNSNMKRVFNEDHLVILEMLICFFSLCFLNFAFSNLSIVNVLAFR